MSSFRFGCVLNWFKFTYQDPTSFLFPKNIRNSPSLTVNWIMMNFPSSVLALPFLITFSPVFIAAQGPPGGFNDNANHAAKLATGAIIGIVVGKPKILFWFPRRYWDCWYWITFLTSWSRYRGHYLENITHHMPHSIFQEAKSFERCEFWCWGLRSSG